MLTTTAQNAINDLTRPWTDVLTPKESGTGKYQPIDFPPLLDMLSEAKASTSGVGVSRSMQGERNLLNLTAFSLWEHIEGTTKAWWQELSKSRCPSELKEALTALAGVLEAAHASGQVKESQYAHMEEMFPRWRTKIWELFDPPRVREFPKVPCPNCGETEYVSGPERTTALIAYYRYGLEPEAKCNCCGDKWSGERQLLELGYSIGAKVDIGVLREMGVVA